MSNKTNDNKCKSKEKTIPISLLKGINRALNHILDGQLRLLSKKKTTITLIYNVYEHT